MKGHRRFFATKPNSVNSKTILEDSWPKLSIYFWLYINIMLILASKANNINFTQPQLQYLELTSRNNGTGIVSSVEPIQVRSNQSQSLEDVHNNDGNFTRKMQTTESIIQNLSLRNITSGNTTFLDDDDAALNTSLSSSSSSSKQVSNKKPSEFKIKANSNILTTTSTTPNISQPLIPRSCFGTESNSSGCLLDGNNTFRNEGNNSKTKVDNRTSLIRDGSSKSKVSSTNKNHQAAKTSYVLTSKSYSSDISTLNHISDSKHYPGKHHHSHDKYVHFEDIKSVGNVTNITVQRGKNVYMNCRISLLQDKTVSWVRRYIKQNELKLLTVGHSVYSGDPRYSVEFQYPNNWRLKIAKAQKKDEGTYECQISTYPPRVIQVNLHIIAPKVVIIDDFGEPLLQDKYYEVDSTIMLSCIVREISMFSSVVFWNHSTKILNYDITRGGISVKTDFMGNGANSTLLVAKINTSDSGNYSCSVSPEQFYTVTVHVLNGESYAELHHVSGSLSYQQNMDRVRLLEGALTILLLLFLRCYKVTNSINLTI